jgi:membrane-bound serine protease (ClpP class)
MEVKVTSYGLLTASGVVSITLGSLMMFESPLPFLRVSLAVILPSTLVTALFFVFTFRLAYKAHKRRPVTGKEALVGLEGTATTMIESSGGMVRVHGELWSAWAEGPIQTGEKVVVESVKGLKVKVARKQVV